MLMSIVVFNCKHTSMASLTIKHWWPIKGNDCTSIRVACHTVTRQRRPINEPCLETQTGFALQQMIFRIFGSKTLRYRHRLQQITICLSVRIVHTRRDGAMLELYYVHSGDLHESLQLPALNLSQKQYNLPPKKSHQTNTGAFGSIYDWLIADLRLQYKIVQSPHDLPPSLKV